MKIVVLLVAVLVAAVLTPASSAESEPAACPSGTTPQAGPAGTICIPAIAPGTPGSATPAGGSSSNQAVAVGCSFNGNSIPCSSPNGTWFSSQQCYAQPTQPPPPEGDPEWDGRSPLDGSVYQCLRPGVNTVWLYFFVPNGEVPALANPAELAEEALGQMELAVPVPNLAPGSPASTYVGLETWLWMDSINFSPLSQTVTAGGTSVTVRAVPVRAVWDLTDGTTTCGSAGRPWRAGMSDAQVTDCSFSFRHVSLAKPGDEFPVSATLTYQVDWVCAGACLVAAGTLGEVDGLPGTSAIQVSERQSVVVG